MVRQSDNDKLVNSILWLMMVSGTGGNLAFVTDVHILGRLFSSMPVTQAQGNRMQLM